jgi:hypothetical protein
MPIPGVIEYPTALDTALSLIEVANNGSSTLTANISVGDLLIPVAQPGKFTNSGIGTLTDDLEAPTKIELFVYTSKSGNNLVVPVGGRGQQGTTAQAFSTGQFVEQRPTALHHTALAALLLLLEAKLGIGAGGPGGLAQALLSDAAGSSVWRAITQGDISGLVAALADKVSKSDAALQTIISNLTLSKDSPALTLVDAVGGSGAEFFINRNGGFTNLGRVGQSDLLLNNTNGEYTFGVIPQLPASNPVSANQAVRKQYVDDGLIPFSVSFFDADPSTSSFFVEDRQGMVFPLNMVGGLITHVFIRFHNGSVLTGGDVLTYTFRKRNTGGSSADIANVTLNSSNGGQALWVTDIADVAVAAGDSLTFYMSARTGTTNPRCVTLGVMGTHKRIP